jgi:hypothetical protein
MRVSFELRNPAADSKAETVGFQTVNVKPAHQQLVQADPQPRLRDSEPDLDVLVL